MAERDWVIEARGLVKRYGSLTAVDNISFDVAAGEVFGMLGPNGAGKSTTLEMLEGLRTPDAGDATVLGESVRRHPRRIKERIGVQLQATALPPKTTVTEAIELFGSFYPRRRAADDLLREFDLTERAGVYAEDLSGGQLQRLSIALALVNDPDLVFLDEPTTGLDPQARLNLWDVITGIHQRGKTVLLTTHYMEEADALCNRLAIVDHGKVIALGTPAELKASIPGGYLLRLRFGKQPAELMTGLQSLAGVREVRSQDGAGADVYADRGGSLIPEVAALATSTGAELLDVHILEPSLENLFLHHTGRSLRD